AKGGQGGGGAGLEGGRKCHCARKAGPGGPRLSRRESLFALLPQGQIGISNLSSRRRAIPRVTWPSRWPMHVREAGDLSTPRADSPGEAPPHPGRGGGLLG